MFDLSGLLLMSTIKGGIHFEKGGKYKKTCFFGVSMD